MKAVVFTQHGPPDQALAVQDVPQPVPQRGQVLVRMIASPVNPSDQLYVEGRYGLKPTFPARPGFEGVGVVEESGGGLLGWFRKGKRVALLNDGGGCWAEFNVVSARQVFPVPDDIPDDQAATYFVNPLSALAITRHVLAVPQGAWLLQTAAGSALGKMVIRLGKMHGFHTLNVVRRREQVEELRQLGADVVLCEADGPISEQVRKQTNGAGVKYAMDPVGGETGTQVVQSLAAGGRAIFFGLLSGLPMSVDPRFLITGSKRVEGFWLADWAKRQRVVTLLRLMREVRSLMRSGVIHTEIGATFPLSQVQEAMREASKPGRTGKVLLKCAG